MLKELRNILGLKTISEKKEEFLQIDKSLKDNGVLLDNLAIEFMSKIKAKNLAIQEVSGSGLEKHIERRFSVFLKSHKDIILSLKKEISVLEKNKQELLKTKEVQELSKGLDKFNLLKSLYAEKKIGLGEFDNILIKATGVVRYADNLVFNQEGKLLILKRNQYDDTNASYWCIPGGHVDYSEDFHHAAPRELQEESGLICDDLILVGIYEDKGVEIHYFKTTINSDSQPVVLQSEEMSDFKWINPYSELDDFEFPFNMKSNIKKFLGIEEPKPIEIIKKALQDGLIDPIKYAEILSSRKKQTEEEQLIEKAKVPKYLRREPNGKGGWYYIYKESEKKIKLNSVEKDKEKIKNLYINAVNGEENGKMQTINRLSLAEEQGRTTGGTNLVTATSAITPREIGDGETVRTKLSAKDQEAALLKAAKENSFLLDSTYLKGKEYLAKGAEAKVYTKGGFVYKVVDYSEQHSEPIEYLDRLALHNYLFPETKYEFIGVIHSGSGIKIVVQQQFINNSNKASDYEVHQEMLNRGFEYIPATKYTKKSKYVSDDYIVEDLHKDNVFISPEGNLMFIDPVIRLNEKKFGLGGVRNLDFIQKSEEYGKGIKKERPESSMEEFNSFIPKQHERDGDSDFGKQEKNREHINKGERTDFGEPLQQDNLKGVEKSENIFEILLQKSLNEQQ